MPVFIRWLPLRNVCLLVSLMVALTLVSAQAQSPARAIPAPSSNEALPPDQAARGLIYAGLTRNLAGPCASLFQISETNLCTHGPDPLPPGVTLSSTPPLIAPGQTPTRPASACLDDGVRGRRIQVLYVRSVDIQDRFESISSTIQLLAEGVNAIYAASASETQGMRQIRFVTEQVGDTCAIDVVPVEISASGDDSFGATISQLRGLGYSRPDRKYLIFMDAQVVCGIGTLAPFDEPALTNLNNLGPSFARVDAPCWTARAAAHEVLHNLGGVQDSAPNSTGSGHCVDEYDLLCYSDAPNYPPMQFVCLDQAHNSRLDCNHDDYFHTNPEHGSYLAQYWNSASSGFLAGAPPGPPVPPPALRISLIERNSMTLIWEDTEDETAYTLYRWINPAEGWRVIATLAADVTTFKDAMLLCEQQAYYQVTASNLLGESLRSAGGMVNGITTSCQMLDSYEADNTLDAASTLIPGTPQQHSIYPAGDADWASFVLTTTSWLLVDTSGSPAGDTVLTLYSSAGNLIEQNDNAPDSSSAYALIDRLCITDPLAPGAYYLSVTAATPTQIIGDYFLDLTAGPCTEVPVVWLPGLTRQP